MFESTYKNMGLVNFHSFEHFTMVFFTTRCRMLESRYNNMGLVTYGLIYRGISMFFRQAAFKGVLQATSRELNPNTKSIKTASGAPRPKSAPRGSKSTTFAQGTFQVSKFQKMVANPIGEPSVPPFQYPIYLWLQAAA